MSNEHTKSQAEETKAKTVRFAECMEQMMSARGPEMKKWMQQMMSSCGPEMKKRMEACTSNMSEACSSCCKIAE